MERNLRLCLLTHTYYLFSTNLMLSGWSCLFVYIQEQSRPKCQNWYGWFIRLQNDFNFAFVISTSCICIKSSYMKESKILDLFYFIFLANIISQRNLLRQADINRCLSKVKRLCWVWFHTTIVSAYLQTQYAKFAK